MLFKEYSVHMKEQIASMSSKLVSLFSQLLVKNWYAFYVILMSQVKTKLKPNSSESTVSKKQEDSSLVKPYNQDVTVLLDSHLPQFTRHQEIWSVLENVWTSIYQNRY